MASKDDLREVSRKLDTVIRLLAVDVIKGRELKDQVRLLHQAGLMPKDIAGILGKTPNAIRVALFSLRKTKGDSP
jgi:hypothetical protein